MSAPGFEFFTSEDAGAPVLNGAAGRLIAVLDWALVGKGGWAKAFSGTNLAAYRSASGNRFYFKVDDTQAKLSRLRGYRAMTSITAGTNAFPLVSTIALASWGINKAYTAGSTARKYRGIRTNRFIVMQIQPSDGYEGVSYNQLVCFGDVPSYCETDTFNTVVFGTQSPDDIGFPSGVGLQPQQSMVGAVDGFHIAATPSGGVNAPSTSLASRFSPLSQTYGEADVDTTKANRLQLDEFSIFSNEAASLGGGYGVLRAKIPNLKHGMGHMPRTGLAVDEEITFGGKTYKLLQNDGYNPSGDGVNFTASGFIALEISDTDGAL